MSIRLVTSWVALTLCLAATGAASADEARDIARSLAVFTNAVKEEITRLADSRAELAVARERIIDALETNAIELETANEKDVAVWTMAQAGSRLTLFQLVRESSDAAAASQERLLARRSAVGDAVAGARAETDTRARKLAAAAKSLGQLSAEPDLEATLAFYVTFFGEVRRSIEEAGEAAEGDADAAAAEVAKE